ncbi:hypothetical protein H9P43_004784 [Blastocladiella emersonii ATCC 22665]|nr:hypothetical protein H9P43_004784 [Blastocladiella emersonii ATCC 22665]
MSSTTTPTPPLAPGQFTALLDLLLAQAELPPSFHTLDGHLATHAHLVSKLRSEVELKGYLPFHLLAPTLQLSQQDCDAVVETLLDEDDDGAVFLLDTYLFSRAGYAKLETDLAVAIAARGVATADALAAVVGKIATALVYQVLEKQRAAGELASAASSSSSLAAAAPAPAVAIRDDIDNNTFYTDAFRTQVRDRLAASLATDRPITIRAALGDLACPTGLLQSTLRELTSSGALAGRVQGGTFVPTVYEERASAQVRDTYASAGYLPLSTAKSLPWLPATGPDAPWHLDTVLLSPPHARYLRDAIAGLADVELVVDVMDAAGGSAWPALADPADAAAFLTRAFGPTSETPMLVAKTKLARRDRVTAACIARATAPVVAAVLARPAGESTEVSRADVARHLAGHVPGAFREVVLGDVVARVQSAVDEAVVHRGDPARAVLEWTAALAVYMDDGLAKLADHGVPRKLTKMLERHLLRVVGPKIAGPLAEQVADAGERAAAEATLAAVIEGKTATLFRKVVAAVAHAAGVAMPVDDEVQTARAAIVARMIRGECGEVAARLVREKGVVLLFDAEAHGGAVEQAFFAAG